MQPELYEQIVIPPDLTDAVIDALVSVWKCPREYIFAFYRGAPN